MIVPPKVSVILTSYNSEKYLHESIESVLNQTYKDFELIIWYDESTDNSWKIITGYTDERIRVFRNKTNQFVAHYQKAISEIARGEYIAIHHSDDLWETDKLEKQVDFLEAHPEIGAVFTRVRIIGENGEPFEDTSHFYYKVFDQPNRTRYEWLNYFFYQGNALCHPSVLIRKGCYTECGLYRYSIAHPNDLDMWVRLCLKYEINILPEKLIRFRVRANEMNASGNRPAARIIGVFGLYQILNNYRAIKSAEEFVKIFPNGGQYFKKEGMDIDFALAMVALEPQTPNYTKLFGLQLLYDLMNDSDRASRLEELYGFGYRDFFTLVAKHDVFSYELVPNLSARLTEKERENQALLSQLQTRNMPLVRRMVDSLRSGSRPLRLRIAPPGSRREKILSWIYYGLKTWKEEGFPAAYKKATSKISGWIHARTPRKASSESSRRNQKKRWSTSLLDLGAVSKLASVPSTYDVILLTRSSGSQRGQQFARRFVQDGHRVFHVSTTFNRGTKTRARPIEAGVFGVQLPESGPETTGALNASAALRDVLGIVDAVCLVEDPFWASLALSLQDRFGWRILYDHTEPREGTGESIREDSLLQNSDLVLEAGEMGEYAQVRQRIPSLFPKASIIIVTYNNVDYTRLCLESLYGRTIYPNFEVIVVDNASSDGTVEFLKSFEAGHKNIRVLCNSVNEGFARANNQGIAASQGDYIVLLNNDTVVTRVWLSRLLRHLSDPQVGLVGPLTNGVSNEAYVEMTFTDMVALEEFAAALARDRSGQLTPIKLLAMYCMAGRRQVFQQVGPLDEQFGIGMFEDDDYSLRVRQAGYRIAVAQDVFIHHFGRSGFKLLGDERYLSLFEENRRKFEVKWNIQWEQHRNGTLEENHQFSADLQDILLAHPQAPGVVIFPPTIGWNISLFQRPHQLARTFAKQGYLVFFSTDDRVDDVKGFQKVSERLFLARVPWAVYDLVERPVIFTLPYNREYIFQLRRPLVVYEVIDDLEVFPGDPDQLQTTHEILLKEADVVLVTADRLMNQVEWIRPDALLCPNAVELDHFSQARDASSPPPDLAAVLRPGHPVIGYYGALARWFDYDLVRAAAQAHPDWEFVLLGPNHDNTLMESDLLSMPNIHWLGARPYATLPEYLRHFTVATIPFLVNQITLATSPIKLFEYMAAGKPIVTSDLPECRKYPGVFAARTPEEFIEHLEHALTVTSDSAYLQQLYNTAQENTWEARVKQIMDAFAVHQNNKISDLQP